MEFSYVFKSDFSSIPELSSLAVAIYRYRWLRHSFMKWTIPFLVFIFLSEMLNLYLACQDKSTVLNNYCILVAELLFYGNVFYHISTRKFFKIAILSFVIFSSVANATTFVVYGESVKPFVFCLIGSGLGLDLIALYYLYTAFNEDIKLSILAQPGFWIAFGICLFFSGISLVFLLHDVIFKHGYSVFGVKLYHFVPNILCVMLYACIVVAIVKLKPAEKGVLT